MEQFKSSLDIRSGLGFDSLDQESGTTPSFQNKSILCGSCDVLKRENSSNLSLLSSRTKKTFFCDSNVCAEACQKDVNLERNCEISLFSMNCIQEYNTAACVSNE